MAFDFPASPSEGQVFQPSGGPSYKYTSGVWTVAAPLANYAFIGDSPPASPVPGQLWWESDTGALFVYFADANSSQWVQINVPAAAVVGVPRGECYLDYIGGILKLSRYNGSQLYINGTNQTIPAAGVDLAATGLTADTAYYIYAYMQNATTMALEASLTAYTPDANGVMVKTGDNTRTLVGIAITQAAATWCVMRCACASWFNPRPKTDTGGLVGTATTSATTMGTDLSGSGGWTRFVTFGSREVRLACDIGLNYQALANADTYTNLVIDSNTNGQLRSYFGERFSGTGSIIQYAPAHSVTKIIAEGRHMAWLVGWVSSSTGTWNNFAVEVTIQG